MVLKIFIIEIGGVIVETSTKIALSLFIIVVLFAVFFLIIRKIFIDRVLKTSAMIKQAEQLNEKYNFHIIKNLFYHNKCNYKRQFDNFNYNLYFIAIVEDSLPFFESYLLKINENIENHLIYSNKFKNIKSTITLQQSKKLKIPFKIYKNIETKQYNKLFIYPKKTITITVRASYTSPKGQNRYSNQIDFSFNELKKAINKVHKNIELKKTREYQRAIMTDSLRYDILKRDNFRCQICGLSASNGVVLHVDHIIPISRGGKTIKANLRTLCDRCNLGKSNKIE